MDLQPLSVRALSAKSQTQRSAQGRLSFVRRRPQCQRSGAFRDATCLAFLAVVDSVSDANILDSRLGDRGDFDWLAAAGGNQVCHRLWVEPEAGARALAAVVSVVGEPQATAAGNRNCRFDYLARQNSDSGLGPLVRDENLEANSIESSPPRVRACRAVAAAPGAGNSFRRSGLDSAGRRRQRGRIDVRHAVTIRGEPSFS